MQRVAALYDIHGNLPALEAVIGELRRTGVDQIVVGGDVVSGPMPRETLDALLSLDVPTQFIMGNADEEVIAQMRGIETSNVPAAFRETVRWVAGQLPEKSGQVIAAWPTTIRMEIEGIGGVLFCHATPRNNTEIFTRLTPDAVLAPLFTGLDVALVVCGHTHMQFDRAIGSIRVVNAGSVGMPYGAAGAYWLLLDSGIDLRRTDYDLAAAAERVRASGYPMADDFADNNIRHPASEDEALAVFTKAQLK